MRAVDTNVLVRLIARDDPRQLAAAEGFVRPGAWASHVVLAELVWVLDSMYDMQPAQIAGTVEMLLEHESLAIQDPEVVRAALARFRGRPDVGFSDCLILEAARKAGHLPLGTFDRDLGKLDGAQVL